MARHRTRVRLARSLRAVVLGVAAVGTATALFEWNLGRGLVLPVGLLAAAPPVAYVILAFVVVRGASAGRRLSWAMAACAVNAAIGVATAAALSFSHPLPFESAVTRAFGAFVPAPLIHMAAAPFILLSFRPPETERRAVPRAGRGGAPASRTVRPRLATPTPNYDDVLPPPTLATWTPAAGAAIFQRARPRDAEAKTATQTAVAPPPAAAAAETAVVTPVVAEPTIVMPPIPEPTIVMPSMPAPTLEIPRLAPPTIAMPPSAPPAVKAKPNATPPAPAVVTEPSAPDEPVLRVAFDRVAAQLPRDVFVLPPERLSESLREPHTLVIPQRLVTPQLGEGVVEIPWTLIEDQFPDLALAVPRSEVHHRYPDWVFSLPMDEVVSQMPADLFHVATPPADLTEIDQFPAPFIEGLPAPEVEDIEPPLEVAAASPSASPPPAPTPSRPPLTQPLAVPVTSAASTATEPRDEQLAALGRSLAVTLAPVGALDWHARRIGGRPLVCFTGPGLDRVAIEALGIRGADLLEQLAPWSVEQVTVRSSRVACVLTPLAAGGALVAAVRRGGPTAWLEVLTARARGGAGRAPSLVARPSAAITTIGEGRGHARIGEAARALAVLGEVVPTEVAAEGGAPGVYVFARAADPSLVSAARAVHDVLVAGHDEGALGRLDGVVLRRGPERVIVRPLRMPEGAPGLLVAAGDVTLTGRAQRAAARAATLLEAR